MRRVRARQRGVALLLLLVILALGATWFMVSKLDALSAMFTARERAHNARVLKRAKDALVGYVAMDASQAGELNPGSLPCPEAAGFIGGASEGQAAASCTLPAVGRLPWRTLGLDKLVDASGQPLWYVVSPGWAKPSPGANTTINSDSVGQLTLDSQANAAVALIIAPGAPMNAQAATGCSARNQLGRGAPSPTINASDYIECFNSATSSFSTVGPSTSFNDQAVAVTAADIMPGIEAAIADRIQREIVPVLKTVYAAPDWGLTSGEIYPFAAPFANPSTSTMQGSAGQLKGFLPFNHSETSPGSGTLCTPSAADPRCAPNFVAWSSATLSGPVISSPDCSGTTATSIDCAFYYRCPLLFFIFCGQTTVSFTLTATASNLGMAMRTLNASTPMTNVDSSGRSASAVLNSNGSATTTLNGTTTVPAGNLVSNLICGISGLLSFTLGCGQSTLQVPITLLADHPILDSSNATYGWYLRNNWHQLTYFVLASGYSPSVRPGQPSCAKTPPPPPPGSQPCLTVANVTPTGAQRAILILTGRGINGSSRPSATLADYLEFGNATGKWEEQPVTATPPSAYADTGAANAYAISAAGVSIGVPLELKAANANAGPSTLNTPATGTKSLKNLNGSGLTPGQIQKGAAVQVAYDGTNFILLERPFNDRIIVLDSN